MRKPRPMTVRRWRRALASLAIAAASAAMLAGFVMAQGGEMFIYPSKGQSPAQQDRDRYECHTWAVQQTGFDPSVPQAPAAPGGAAPQPYQPSQPHVLRGAGRGAAMGAVGGAIAGNAGTGAAAGAAVGGMAGAIRRREERRQQTTQQQADVPSAAAQQGQQAQAYRRAMTACLEGRGYTVK